MASAWGSSWNVYWGVSWGDPEVDVVVPVEVELPFSGAAGTGLDNRRFEYYGIRTPVNFEERQEIAETAKAIYQELYERAKDDDAAEEQLKELAEATGSEAEEPPPPEEIDWLAMMDDSLALAALQLKVAELNALLQDEQDILDIIQLMQVEDEMIIKRMV